MTMMFFEGFETCGTELGLANQSTTRPRTALRWEAAAVPSGNEAVNSFWITDDTEDGNGFAIIMGETADSQNNYLRWEVPTANEAYGVDWIIGFRIHIPSTTESFAAFTVRTSVGGSGPSTADNWRINVIDSTDVQLAATSFVRVTVLDVFTPGSWHVVEMKFTVGNGTAGAYNLYVDGVEVADDQTADLDGQAGHDTLESFMFKGNSASVTAGNYTAYDDIYVLLDDATAPNDYLGITHRVLSLGIDGDDTSQWTTSSGTVHYTLVDENGADATDNISHGTDTERDLFDIAAPSSGGDIHAVKVEVEAIDETAGANSIDVEIKSVSTTQQTNHNVTSTTAYAVFTHYSMLDPDAAAAWTDSTLAAAVAGVQFNT